jgi:hypothetical protein
MQYVRSLPSRRPRGALTTWLSSAIRATVSPCVQAASRWVTVFGLNFNLSEEHRLIQANVLLEHIKCPGAIGTKCVFQITISSQNQVGSNDLPANPSEEGLYQFLVDGTPPSPGPTLVGGFYLWTLLQAASSISAVSTAVTGSVTNSAANQVHSISVGISCNEVNGDNTGCFESTQFANLQIARYQP